MALDMSAERPTDSQPVNAETRSQLLDPILAAVCTTLGEMAGVTPIVRNLYRQPDPQPWGDWVARLPIQSGPPGALHVCFPYRTAKTLAERIMTNVAQQIDDSLVRDCMGEIANVVGGQAKALLAESPYPWQFVMPPTVIEAERVCHQAGASAWVILLACEAGDLAIQLTIDGATDTL